MTPKCVRAKKRIIDVLNTPKVLFLSITKQMRGNLESALFDKK